MIRDTIQKLLRFLTGYDNLSLSTEDASYVEKWILDYGRRLAHTQAKASSVSYLIAAALGAFIIPTPYDFPLTMVLTALGLEGVAWLLIEQNLSRKIEVFALRMHAFLTNALAMIGMSIFLHASLTSDNFNFGHLIVAGCLWAGMGWNLAIFTPVIGYSNIYVLISLYVCSSTMVFLAGAEDFMALVYAISLVTITLCGYFISQLARIKDHALTQCKANELERKNQILRLKAIETEMQITSQLQANLAPPPPEVDDAHHRIRFYHVPYGKLGGDLLLTRDMADGSQIIAVGDVTGKGVPAAMVVQVVQSLWADHLHSDDFSPLAWIHLVNQTLLNMGSKPGTHTLTLGLLVLHHDHAVYYCAGHIPIYLTTKETIPPKIRPIFGYGMPIGIVDNPEISPVNIVLPRSEAYTVLLGSDGILDWQTRKNPTRLYTLIRDIEQIGDEAIKMHPVDDDKILVAISESKAA